MTGGWTRRRWLGAPAMLGAWVPSVASSNGRSSTANTASVVSAASAAGAADDAVRRGRRLVFPRDHGAHPGSAIEWWYLTGWLGTEAAPRWGFQVTFFRRRIAAAESSTSRFAARQLLFAHAALTDLTARQHHHAQRLVRWDGRSATPPARCERATTDVQVQRWSLARAADGTLSARIDGPFALDLALAPTQPLLLQGDAGFSRKGAQERHASHYYSQPHLAVMRGRVSLDGRSHEATGRAWLDHEWSDALMADDAVGWDWIGMNLDGGASLTAFRLRDTTGRALWAGGSHRDAAGTTRIFEPGEVHFEPERQWASGTSGARYPVRWRLRTPAGEQVVDALLDAQELDHRNSTGVLYWEGLAALLDGAGRRVGLGYLEMTGYGQPLRLT